MAEPKFKAAGLWEKTSASGNRYFVGRWGGVRILIFANRDRQGDNDPSHHLYIAEAPDKPRQAAGNAQTAAGSSSATRQHRQPGAGNRAPDLPDDTDDLRRLIP